MDEPQVFAERRNLGQKAENSSEGGLDFGNVLATRRLFNVAPGP
jgi:hypothetical protein